METKCVQKGRTTEEAREEPADQNLSPGAGTASTDDERRGCQKGDQIDGLTSKLFRQGSHWECTERKLSASQSHDRGLENVFTLCTYRITFAKNSTHANQEQRGGQFRDLETDLEFLAHGFSGRARDR